MQGPGVKPKYKEYSTTIWLASESDNPNTHKFLKPFGWASLSEMSDQEICAFEKDKKENFDNWEIEQQQTIIAFHEKAKELARLREVEELERKKAAEEKQAREENLRKYPWRVILSKLDTIQDWGALKTQVLEAPDFQQYQSENEVGEAVSSVAGRVAKTKRKKWDVERDAFVAEWLRASGTKWQSMTKETFQTDTGMTQEETNVATQIESLSDWGQYKNSGIKMGELTLATAQILACRFKDDWGCTNKKAKKDKKQAWKNLQKQLKQLRKRDIGTTMTGANNV